MASGELCPLLIDECVSLEGHTGTVRSLLQLEDNRVVSGSSDRTLRVWDTLQESGGTEGQVVQQGHAGAIYSLCTYKDGESVRVASGSFDNTVRCWNPEQSTPLAVFQGHPSTVDAVLSLTQDGKEFVLAASGPDIRFWSVDTGRSGLVLRVSARVFALHMTPECLGVTSLVAVCVDSMVRLWDPCLLWAERIEPTVVTVAPLMELSSAGVCAVSSFLAPDSTEVRLVTGSEDRTVRVWSTGVSTRDTLVLQGHTAEISTVTTMCTQLARSSPAGRSRSAGERDSDSTRILIMSGSEDCSVRVWDACLGVLLAVLRGHTLPVLAIACSFHDDGGLRIVSGGEDNVLKVWRLPPELSRLPHTSPDLGPAEPAGRGSW